ncbi:MAG: TolC family protein [Tannerellaceae bacterium]|nr:TolC family protein [Tannerellaceae bacterium]
MKTITLFIILFAGPGAMLAEGLVWTMDDCMRYAVEHSAAVRQKAYAYDTYGGEQASALASFLPAVELGSAARYSFGRAVDPETNTYVNTTTFNNYYEIYASMPLFRGGQLVNQWRMAKANRQMGMNDMLRERDDLALNTMEAFANAVYYLGAAGFAAQKREESLRLLHKARREEELGLKGKADVAIIEAQAAADDYLLTRQENLSNTALLKLKEYMNFPLEDELRVDTAVVISFMPSGESAADIFAYASDNNPAALEAAFRVRASRMQLLAQRGRLLPSVTLSGGVNTGYFENLKSEAAPLSFASQMKNNRGEYVGVSVSYPLFDGLSRVTEVRRARNNLRIAVEAESEALRKLHTAIEQSLLDREGYAKESVQMEKKLMADSIAYRATSRKYEEGLMSPLDLQTSANILLESRANLLKGRLMYLLKCRQVDYYRGGELIRDNKQTTTNK